MQISLIVRVLRQDDAAFDPVWNRANVQRVWQSAVNQE